MGERKYLMAVISGIWGETGLNLPSQSVRGNQRCTEYSHRVTIERHQQVVVMDHLSRPFIMSGLSIQNATRITHTCIMGNASNYLVDNLPDLGSNALLVQRTS